MHNVHCMKQYQKYMDLLQTLTAEKAGERCFHRESRLLKFSLPVQVNPFPSNPSKQEHWKDPGWLEHVACGEQGKSVYLHSSSSSHNVPSPFTSVKPSWQVQLYPPYVFVHREKSGSQRSVPLSHSSISVRNATN